MALNDLLTAAEMSLERLKEREDEAAADATGAFTRYVERQAALESIQHDIARTEAAIAAMKGEIPVMKEAKTADSHTDVAPSPSEEATEAAEPPSPTRKVVKRPTGPYANIECPGCGAVGSLYDGMNVINGRPVRMLTCSSCKSSRPS